MSELFSEEWMENFKIEWNNETNLVEPLEKINFCSTIAYGFENESTPRGIIKVENGKVTEANKFNGENLNWDLRAKPESWNKWFKKGIGAFGLGVAYTSRKLKFNKGDYTSMIKDPRMAGPFIKSFSVMGKVQF